MFLKNYSLIRWISIPLLALFMLLSTLSIYYNGGTNETAGATLLYICIVLLPIVAFPSYFFMIHYWYYRNKDVQKKLIITTLSFLLALLFVISFWIDKSSTFLEEKKLMSFVTGILFDASALFYIVDLIKTNR